MNPAFDSVKEQLQKEGVTDGVVSHFFTMRNGVLTQHTMMHSFSAETSDEEAVAVIKSAAQSLAEGAERIWEHSKREVGNGNAI